MTPLRKQMLDDMVLRGLSKATQRAYVDAVVGLAKFYRRSPETISDREIQRYLVYLHQERGLAPVSCNRVVHGLRFFYRETMGREQQAFRLPCARQPSKLPEVLSREEVARLFAVTENLKHGTLFKTSYASGPRVSETVHLKLTDIDSERMTLRIESGKRQKDRYALWPKRLLEQLRLLLESVSPQARALRQSGGHRPALACHRKPNLLAKARAGITKSGGPPCAPAALATQLLEAGTD